MKRSFDRQLTCSNARLGHTKVAFVSLPKSYGEDLVVTLLCVDFAILSCT